MFECLWVKTALVITAVLAVIAGKVFWHLPDDHPVEEIAEQVIENQTGIEIDFSSEGD